MNNKGFTLIEVLIALVVLACLGVLVIPTYQRWVEEAAANAAIEQLYRAIELARSEAIKSNQMVTLCPSSNGDACENDWSNGYMIFIDKKQNGIKEKDDQLIRLFTIKNRQFGNKKAEIHWSNFRTKNYLQITSFGFTNFLNGTFLYCPNDHDVHFARALFIGKNGKVYFSEDTHHEGIHRDLYDKPLSC